MKKYLPYLLLAVMILPVAAFADDDDEHEEEMEEMVESAELQLEMTNIQLEQQRAELDFNFEQQMRELEIENMRREMDRADMQVRGRGYGGHHRAPHKMLCIAMMMAILARIFVPIWIYKDMRQRNTGSVLLVLLGIIGGLFGLLAYAIVRLGDINAGTKTTRK